MISGTVLPVNDAIDNGLCSRVTTELVRRLRVAGHSVGTPASPTDLQVIDGIPSDLHVEMVERWGRPGIHVWWGQHECLPDGELKSNRNRILDYETIVERLLHYLEQKRERLRQEDEIESLRHKAVQVITGCGVRMVMPRACHVGKASLRIESCSVAISIRVPIRHRHKLRTIVHFLQCL